MKIRLLYPTRLAMPRSGMVVNDFCGSKSLHVFLLSCIAMLFVFQKLHIHRCGISGPTTSASFTCDAFFLQKAFTQKA